MFQSIAQAKFRLRNRYCSMRAAYRDVWRYGGGDLENVTTNQIKRVLQLAGSVTGCPEISGKLAGAIRGVL
jgi:hypothetical protein